MSDIPTWEITSFDEVMKMRRMAGVFIIAVLVPTLVLAWLAMRSLRDQEIVANSQRAILHQSSTEALAADVNTFMDDVRLFYDQMVNDLVDEIDPEKLTTEFDRIAPQTWSQCLTAAVVTDKGRILCPKPSTTDPFARAFLAGNGTFLLNKSSERYYQAEPLSYLKPVIADNRLQELDSNQPSRGQYKVEVAEQKMRKSNPLRRMNDIQQRVVSADDYTQPNKDINIQRNVVPSQQVFNTGQQRQLEWDNSSQLAWDVGKLQEVVGGEKSEGALSRFQQDGLHVLLWKRHPDLKERIFWVELNLNEIKRELRDLVSGYDMNPDICLAILDSEGQLVSKAIADFEADWSKPFVASEVGQILPHWEIAAYLRDPTSVNRSAKTAKLMLWLLVPTLLSTIGVGTFLIFRSMGTEMRLARQKTDFVSSVSHELRTPLTSIRMFSDLLTAEAHNEKDREYSGIISREAARLTRLINNLLDFSRLERSDHSLATDSIDLNHLTSETLETYRMQIEADGCHLVYEPAEIASPLMVRGDRDALSQVLLNLLSNADKYGAAVNEESEILVRLQPNPEQSTAEWQVLDRGPGIDRKHAARIFDKFYRVDDSLSNGIQGSGLGLALAHQIIIQHQGEIRYHRRSGGGSCFTVTLPIVN